MNNLKTIIFDLDGTLVNSLDDLAFSCNFALSSCGYSTHQTSEYPNFVGRGIRNLVRQAMPAEWQSDEAKLDVCFGIFYDTYKDNCCKNTYIYEGITDLLTALKQQGLKLAVLSNKSHELAQMVVGKLFPNSTFDLVLGASDTLPRKPSPDGIVRICEHFGITKSETILIGDSAVDINTARNAGIKVCTVSWGFQKIETLIPLSPDFVIDKPCDFLNLTKL